MVSPPGYCKAMESKVNLETETRQKSIQTLPYLGRFNLSNHAESSVITTPLRLLPTSRLFNSAWLFLLLLVLATPTSPTNATQASKPPTSNAGGCFNGFANSVS